MTSFPKSYRYQLPPMLVYRLQLATIGIWFHLSRLFSKLYAAFETLGGKARYIRTVQYPAFVQAGGVVSIQELSS